MLPGDQSDNGEQGAAALVGTLALMLSQERVKVLPRQFP
jgi:hypothetical protein